jgi:hypothetical protein
VVLIFTNPFFSTFFVLLDVLARVAFIPHLQTQTKITPTSASQCHYSPSIFLHLPYESGIDCKFWFYFLGTH